MALVAPSYPQTIDHPDIIGMQRRCMPRGPQDCRSCALRFTWEAATHQFLENLQRVSQPPGDAATRGQSKSKGCVAIESATQPPI
jgi:hypothetical protein